ncbi:hypothetical protein ACLOJK_038273, partial [Asimina triloba]
MTGCNCLRRLHAAEIADILSAQAFPPTDESSMSSLNAIRGAMGFCKSLENLKKGKGLVAERF